ncbi:MAG: SOS response-associated peptidase [Bacteroidota bacterium]|jgi:putative SOS response-associated peptidase YedK
MCFSYAINFSANALQSKLQLGDVGSLDIQLPWETPSAEAAVREPGYFISGFDRPLMPVVTLTNAREQYALTAMRWGLVPHWCKSQEQSQELSLYGLNARAETLDEKPLFRDAWKSQPCLVPVSGFFEWQSVGKRKQPYYIYSSDQSPLLIAGVFAVWLDTQTGEEMKSYSIITTEANALMSEIHNVKKRMPVILGSDDAKAYLRSDVETRAALLKPCEESVISAHPVGTWLNAVKAQRNVSQALLPIEKDFPQTLF